MNSPPIPLLSVLEPWMQAVQTTRHFGQIQLAQQIVASISRETASPEMLQMLRGPADRDQVFALFRYLAATNPAQLERITEAVKGEMRAQVESLQGAQTSSATPDTYETSPATTPWFQRLQDAGRHQPGLLHMFGKALAAAVRDPNEGLDPSVSPGETRLCSHPPPVHTIQEGTERLLATGWDFRVDAIRKWADRELKDLPRSHRALEALLADIQWFRADLANHLEGLLSSFETTGLEKDGLYKSILAYHDILNRWLAAERQTHSNLFPRSQIEVEFALEREGWEAMRLARPAATALSEEDLAGRGLSPLAIGVLGLYDQESNRAPVQALPESTVRYILTQNPHLSETSEAQRLLEAAERYYGAGRRPAPSLLLNYVAAMRAFLADPVRAQHFLIELSFVDTVRNLILQDPAFIVEEILKEKTDQIFPLTGAPVLTAAPSWIAVHQALETAIGGGDPEAIRSARVSLEELRSQLGRRAMQFLFDARDKLEKAQADGSPLKIARAKQIHDNILSTIMVHFGPRLIPYLATHPRYANLRANRPDFEDVIRLRRDLYLERARLARSQRSKWEAAAKAVNQFWSERHDPGLAELHEKVFQYLIHLSDELMETVRSRSPSTYQKTEGDYRHARDRAEEAIREFIAWEARRRAHVARMSHGETAQTSEQDPFVPRDYNRAIEKALKALLGTAPELPAFQWIASRKARKTPGLFEVVRQAMEAGNLPGANFHPVVPLFTAFASNYRPLPKDEKRRVGWENPKQALAGLTGGLLADLYAGERRGDGNDFGDTRLLEWSIMIGSRFHDNTVVVDPLTVGGLLTHFSAPVIDGKHTSWGADFNAMVQIAAAVSPRPGDPVRMRPPRILGKADLSGMIPIMGSGIKHFTIPVQKGLYRGVEIRAARAIAYGDVLHDLEMVESVRNLGEFREVRVASRPGPRPIGVFSEITMPVSDAINPFDPTPEGTLAIPSISASLPPIGRGTYISLMAEAITGKPQMMLWPVTNGSFATFPKPDARVRLYRGKTRMVIPDPIFNDFLPPWSDPSTNSLAGYFFTVGNLQRTVWWLSAMVPENQTPAPQEAEYLGELPETGGKTGSST